MISKNQLQLVQFPKQYPQCISEKCVLIEPLDGVLRSQNFESCWVTFRIRIPDAIKVAVLIDDDSDESKTHQMSFADGEWFVRVYLEKYFNKGKSYKACVSAVLPNRETRSQATNTYWTLLEYIIE